MDRNLLGVFGDSFCDLNPKKMLNLEKGIAPWPMFLSELLNKPFESHCMAATSIWAAFKNFQRYHSRYDTIVFCYTNPNRWATVSPSEGLAPIRNKNQLDRIKDPEQLVMATALVNASPYLYDEDFDNYCFQKMFDDVNLTCAEKNIKLINILAFEGNQSRKISINITKASGPVLTDLQGVAFKEVRPPKVAELLNNGPDLRFCHLNPHNNKALANLIYELLESKITVNHIHLSTDPRFSYDPIHLKYLE